MTRIKLIQSDREGSSYMYEGETRENPRASSIHRHPNVSCAILFEYANVKFPFDSTLI